MSLRDRHLEQIGKFNTSKDHRSHNGKVSRLLRALAIELKDLPHDKQIAIDHIINDLRDGYKFDWLGIINWCRARVE